MQDDVTGQPHAPLAMQERQFSNEMRVLLNLPLSGWVGEATSQLRTRNAINTCNTNKFGSPS